MSEAGALEFTLDPPLTSDLREELIAHWVAVTNAGGAVGFVPPVDASDIAPVASSMFAKIGRGDARIVVARRAGKVIGFAFLVFRPGPLFRHWATIKNLQVHPSQHRTGAGRELLAAVERAAGDLGLEQLHLTVRGGTGIEHFYLKQGYEIVARIPDLIRVAEGDDREELYLRKLL